MRVAALYDIHGNLPALEAVLDEVRSAGIDHVVVGGDVIPGPMPSECIALLEKVETPLSWIVGNGERDTLALGVGTGAGRVPEAFRPLMAWSRDQLSAHQMGALETWPLTESLEVDGLGRVLFCHATPRDDNELFTEITPEEHLLPVFDPPGVPVVVCGHTHMQFDRRIGSTRVINAGSVGLPFGDPGAFWVIVASEVEFRRTEYDLESAHARIARTTYPGVESFDVRHPPGAAQMMNAFEASAIGSGGHR